MESKWNSTQAPAVIKDLGRWEGRPVFLISAGAGVTPQATGIRIDL
jgi:hypothetical protein